MKRGAIGTLQLIVIIAVLSIAFTTFIIFTAHLIENRSTVTANVENGLITEPLN